ncbi:DUF4920 domain-containing protein [Tenacibaculum sp. IB213877]|uniref:DUF4920 domain-containing protein n=1 Tax=Tenacibaculum sp. IB213877 TaxID=3097351 RepID=UPI002A59C524|nr:DUF4920 domain-containing protein [Tenacibaculum sp. IB213877]MDY0780309.1 DUF4920 domain-containing protein [Tenacibaculum sp. IB213877]
MKRVLVVLFVLVLTSISCKNKQKEDKELKTYVSFGDKINADGAITKTEMAKKFEGMQVGDTVDVKFATKIDEVCQKKGCWIKVPLEGEKQSFVRFKDYAFFMPFNSAGSEVVLNGKAFKSEISVKQLQHYAKDAGKSDEEIAKITEPKVTYSFLADGVLLEAKEEEPKANE